MLHFLYIVHVRIFKFPTKARTPHSFINNKRIYREFFKTGGLREISSMPKSVMLIKAGCQNFSRLTDLSMDNVGFFFVWSLYIRSRLSACPRDVSALLSIRRWLQLRDITRTSASDWKWPS